MEKLPILLDTDPGLDDAIAILVLAHFAKERLDTVISSYGNVSLALTTRNLLRCCNLFEIAPHLIRGSEHPLSKPTHTDAADIHGADGLAGIDLPPADLPVVTEQPIEALYQRILTLGQVDYITLGPLTNLARLLQAHPDVKSHLHSVTTMGGGFQKGNITRYAEFNIYCDPLAAQIVCDAKLPQLFVPLNTTHQIALSLDEIDQICRTRSAASGYLRQILTKNYETNTAQGDEGCIIHDASAVIAYLFPECFTTKACTVSVLTDPPRDGETLLQENINPPHQTTVTADRTAVMRYLAAATEL